MNQNSDYFQSALARHVDVYADLFGERLCAVYVWGSVHRGEAVRGVSDLDLHAFIEDALTSEDGERLAQARNMLDTDFPGLGGLSRPFSENVLHDGAKADAREWEKTLARSLGFRLCYDATLIYGLKQLPEAIVPTPDANFARGPFEAVRDLARFAAGAESENKTDFILPDDPALRLRKLARLAVLGGGYLLMAQEQCCSFRGGEVLPLLQSALPSWQPFLTKVEHLYVFPAPDAAERLVSFQQHLVEWTEYIHTQLNRT